MIPPLFVWKEIVSQMPFKHRAVCSFTVKVMASGTPLDLKEDVFVKKIWRTMEEHAKVFAFTLLNVPDIDCWSQVFYLLFSWMVFWLLCF